MREICDQILAGQGVGVFTYPRLKRLMEDESLRELVCSKLNLGLDVQHFEDDFMQEMVRKSFGKSAFTSIDFYFSHANRNSNTEISEFLL